MTNPTEKWAVTYGCHYCYPTSSHSTPHPTPTNLFLLSEATSHYKASEEQMLAFPASLVPTTGIHGQSQPRGSKGKSAESIQERFLFQIK